jgi:SAM-dependent methyltransferase
MTEKEDYELQSIEAYYPVDHMLEFFDDVLAPVPLTDRVLHVGCGRGEVLLRSRLWEGVDFNEKLDEVWRALGIRWRCWLGDARTMKFPSGQYQWTVSCDFLEHVARADLEKVAANLHRVAKHGRHLIDTLPQSSFRGVGGKNLHPSGGLSKDEWKSVLQADSVERVRSSADSRFLLAVW